MKKFPTTETTIWKLHIQPPNKYDRYNLMWEIESILSSTTDTTRIRRDTTAFFNGNQRKQLVRQIQQNVSQNALLCFQHGGGGRLLLQQKRQMTTRYTAVYEPHRVAFALQAGGLSFIRQIQLYGNQAFERSQTCYKK